MVQVPDTFLKGNYGETYLSFLLSSECLVRTTTSDVGIDLYCESVVDERPFSHFWVQVKTGDQVNVISKGKRASYSFDTGHLAYWRTQPIPIFAALVPQHQWPPSTELKPALGVYIIDISSQLLDDPSLGESRKTIRLRSNYRWHSDSLRNDVHGFVRDIVPETTARLLCSKGIIPPIPEPEERYVKRMPEVPAYKYQDKISRQMRWTASTAVIDSHRKGKLGDLDADFRHKMNGILNFYGSWWDAHFARGLLHHFDGQFTEAVPAYGQAIKKLEDPRFREENPSWTELESEVKRCKFLASRGQPLSRPQAN